MSIQPEYHSLPLSSFAYMQSQTRMNSPDKNKSFMEKQQMKKHQFLAVISMLIFSNHSASADNLAQIIDVGCVIANSDTPEIILLSKGQTPTGGWRNARLVPRQYIDFPTDGIQDVDMLADPPDGMATQVISTHVAKLIMGKEPENLTGFRVHSATNHKEILLSECHQLFDPGPADIE